jgi:hypothetical protein
LGDYSLRDFSFYGDAFDANDSTLDSSVTSFKVSATVMQIPPAHIPFSFERKPLLRHFESSALLTRPYGRVATNHLHHILCELRGG